MAGESRTKEDVDAILALVDGLRERGALGLIKVWGVEFTLLPQERTTREAGPPTRGDMLAYFEGVHGEVKVDG